VTRADGRAGWLLEHLGGVFTILRFGDESEQSPDLRKLGNLRPELRIVQVDGHPDATAGSEMLGDPEGLARARYGGSPGVTYLIRPDQHVAARFAGFDPDALSHALRRATLREAA
jgi:3-(3-hydroxy-phenyl)propionate hydroxylase